MKLLDKLLKYRKLKSEILSDFGAGKGWFDDIEDRTDEWFCIDRDTIHFDDEKPFSYDQDEVEADYSCTILNQGAAVFRKDGLVLVFMSLCTGDRCGAVFTEEKEIKE